MHSSTFPAPGPRSGPCDGHPLPAFPIPETDEECTQQLNKYKALNAWLSQEVDGYLQEAIKQSTTVAIQKLFAALLVVMSKHTEAVIQPSLSARSSTSTLPTLSSAALEITRSNDRKEGRMCRTDGLPVTIKIFMHNPVAKEALLKALRALEIGKRMIPLFTGTDPILFRRAALLFVVQDLWTKIQPAVVAATKARKKVLQDRARSGIIQATGERQKALLNNYIVKYFSQMAFPVPTPEKADQIMQACNQIKS